MGAGEAGDRSTKVYSIDMFCLSTFDRPVAVYQMDSIYVLPFAEKRESTFAASAVGKIAQPPVSAKVDSYTFYFPTIHQIVEERHSRSESKKYWYSGEA